MLGLRGFLGRTGAGASKGVSSKHSYVTGNLFRPRQGSPRKNHGNGQRNQTTEAGDKKSGHINAGPNEAILFLDSMLHVLEDRTMGTDATV